MAVSFIYRFGGTVPMEEVQDSLLLAAMATEGLHGATRVRLEAKFALDPEERAVRIEASNGVGRDLARIFTGLLSQQFGEAAYSVRDDP